MNLSFRNALTNDASRLTEIAFAAKQTWNYPQEYIEIWSDELTITKAYIECNKVLVAEVDGNAVGFASLVYMGNDEMFGEVFVSKGWWMDHLFIDPKYQQMGIGWEFIREVKSFCLLENIAELQIFVDPNATGFYEKMGARFVRNSPSSIEGREIPVYVLEIF